MYAVPMLVLSLSPPEGSRFLVTNKAINFCNIYRQGLQTHNQKSPNKWLRHDQK